MSKLNLGVDVKGGMAPLYLGALLYGTLSIACDDGGGGGVADASGAVDATQVVPGTDGGAEDDSNSGPPLRPTEPPADLPPPSKPPTQSGVIVAVSHDLLISVSRDSGTTWTQVSYQTGLPETQMLLLRASFTNGRYFATGWRFFSSADAVTFSEVSLPTSQWFGDVVFGNGKYVTAGGWGTFLTSTDGVTWTQGKLPGINENVTSVAFGGGRFALSLVDGTVYGSADGTTWVADATLKTRNLAYCGGAFKDGSECGKPDPAASVWQGHGYWYFARWPDTLMRSTDGRNFQPVATFPAGIRDLAFGDEEPTAAQP